MSNLLQTQISMFLSLLSTLHDQEVAPAIRFLADPRISFLACTFYFSKTLLLLAL